MASSDVQTATMAPAMSAEPQDSRQRRLSVQPFDARLLARKLEAHKYRQRLREPHEDPSTHTMSSAPYIPRNAARQFEATTTTKKGEPARERKRSGSLAHKPEPAFSTGDPSHVNPKQRLAAMAMGMSESEASATATDAPSPRRASVPTLPKQDELSLQRSTSPSAPTERPRYSYMPGDAAKRNAERRRSQMGPPPVRLSATLDRDQHHEHPIQHPRLSTSDVPAFRQSRDQPNEMPYDLPMPHDGEHSHEAGGRPKLSAHDRNDWAQASQAGEDMRHLLHMPHLPHVHIHGRHATDGDKVKDKEKEREKTKHKRQSMFVEDTKHEKSETSRGVAGANQQGMRPRQKSEGDASNNLVSDAVKLIKKEEKQKRRMSIVGFFKRF